MWPRLHGRHALSIKLWKTACLPASPHHLPSLLLVWVWELLGRVAMAVDGALDQSLATLPTAVSLARILLRRKRRKICSISVVGLTMTAGRVMRPPQTPSSRRIMQTGFRSLPTLPVPWFTAIPLLVRPLLKSFHGCPHPLFKPRSTSLRCRGPVSP